MATAVRSKLTSKRQVTVPRDVCVDLGLREGDEIEWVRDKSGVRVRKVLKRDRFAPYRKYFADLEGKDVDALIEEWRGR